MTPSDWATRLYAELIARKPGLERVHRYVEGRHDDPTVDAKASRAFRRIIGLSKTNLTGLIVEATAERLAVEGFRFGDKPEADDDAWAIWQNSDFDAESEALITAALTDSRSFMLVEPPQSGEKWPRLYAEDASQMVVAYEPGRRQNRLAALKCWKDDWTDDTFATLYLPGSLHKLKTRTTGASMPRWEFRVDGVESEPNRLGEVPVFELRNRPTLRGAVRSEIEDVISDQDRANHIALNALIAAEYGAFRQKWATGIEVPRDPVSGAPIEPFNVAVNRLLVAEGSEAKFGDFNPTDLKPYIELYEMTVRHMAGVSRTPVIYLLGGLVNIGAETVALSISGLVNKCRRRALHFEQPFEGGMRCAFKSIGDPRAFESRAETIWMNPEIRSQAQEADRAVKLSGGAGAIVPIQQLREDLGYTPTQRARMEQYDSEDDAIGNFTAMLEQQAAPFAPMMADGVPANTPAP